MPSWWGRKEDFRRFHDWQMSFNRGTCKVIHLGRARYYKLHLQDDGCWPFNWAPGKSSRKPCRESTEENNLVSCYGKRGATKCWILSIRELKEKQNNSPFTQNHRTSLVKLHQQLWSAHLKDGTEPKGNKEGQLKPSMAEWKKKKKAFSVWQYRGSSQGTWSKYEEATATADDLTRQISWAKRHLWTMKFLFCNTCTLFIQLPVVTASAGSFGKPFFPPECWETSEPSGRGIKNTSVPITYLMLTRWLLVRLTFSTAMSAMNLYLSDPSFLWIWV